MGIDKQKSNKSWVTFNNLENIAELIKARILNVKIKYAVKSILHSELDLLKMKLKDRSNLAEVKVGTLSSKTPGT